MYHADYVIDSFILRDEPLWYHKLGIFYIIEQINIIRREVNGIKEKGMANLAALEFSLNLGGASLSEANSENFDALTGHNYEAEGEVTKPIDYVELFEDEVKKRTEELTNGLTQLSVLSIVGMPGIGKTTLANSIYQSPLVLLHFHVHARCCVTQLYQKRSLLLEILQEVTTCTKPRHGLATDELAEKLYKSLKGKMYLIFFDDLWDTRLWNDTTTFFPDDNMGSRILFTSRFHNIVSQIERRSITYPLHPLSEVRRWKLVQVKLFQKECYPQELLGVEMQMAINCKGLPLAVDLVVGLLRNTERRKDCWERIASSLNTHLLADQQGRCWGILELSYNHLPNYLKPCFLYFRAFPGDEEVPVSELMWLWIAEGFVQPQKDEKGSLEDVAKKYLSDLIARNLVMKTKRGSLGGVKACCIHDLLRDFAFAKAKE